MFKELLKNKNKIRKRIKPSKKASYIWLGCLGTSLEEYKIPHWFWVGIPTSSPLIKFAIRPKNIPTGQELTTKLVNS